MLLRCAEVVSEGRGGWSAADGHRCADAPVHNALSVTRRNQKYETRSPGVVPDFDRLHRDFDMEMTRVRSNMRRNITVPVEFKLNGVTPEDQHERDHKVRHLG